MNEDQIKKLCPKAENINVTGSTVGMKVGEFAMARNISLSHEPGNAERQIKDLYYDLMAMNREQESQAEEARIARGQ